MKAWRYFGIKASKIAIKYYTALSETATKATQIRNARMCDSTNGIEHSAGETDREYINGSGVSRPE